jgi:hypothetical protein
VNESDLILEALARKNFWAFCYYYDREFFSRKRPFLYDLAVQLQRIADGEIKRLSISLPPRAGKSYMMTLFCVWLIGLNPDGSVMRNCTTATLYNKFSYDAREIIRSEKFKRVFPEVELSPDKQSVTGWNVTKAKQVTYFGNGVGGTIIGFGASLVAITDDLYRGHEDAMSETINEKTHRWYESAHLSRIEKGCPQVDIGTRWSKSDVIGQNIEDGYYDHSIIVPAIINGETFCDDVKTTEEYREIEDRTDSYIWNSEYMQQPVELDGVIFPESELIKYEKLPEEGVDLFFADTADAGDDSYSVPFGRIYEGKVYIFDVVFNKYRLIQNEPIMLAKMQEYNISRGYIEANNAGAYHKDNLKEETDTPLYGLIATGNKILRILVESGWIIKNFRFPSVSPGPDYDKFYRELISLLKTGNKHDDSGDSLSGLSKMIQRDFRYLFR